jgi:signal transduction histidine kinase
MNMTSLLSQIESQSCGELQQRLRLQLESIARQYSAIAVLIQYQDAVTEEYYKIAAYIQENITELDSANQNYLESGKFLADVPLNSGLCSLSLSDGSVIYIQSLGRIDSERLEYILLWSEEPLSNGNQHSLEQQIHAIRQYLELEKKCYCQSNEIQLLEQVLQRMEHQLRHPLALVQLYTDNLQRSLPVGNTQDQVVVIQQFLQQLRDNLNHLVDYAQSAKLRPGLHSLQTILASSIAGLQPLIQEKELQINYPTATTYLSVDGAQIKQVLDNLLHNAICYSPVQSIITLNWQAFHREVLITIADQGSGFTSDDLQQMFKPFYSKRPGGTGLGLAIAKKIVLDHCGNLWADNLPEGGAQFSIVLPR